MNRSTITMLQVTVMMAVTFFLSSYQSVAQNTRRAASKETSSFFKYKGIEASFGIRSFKLESDIPELQNFTVMEEGGSAAFIFGNSFIRAAARIGLYYSTAGTKRTVDQFEIELNTNIYLLKALGMHATKADVYMITGFSNQNLKFFGHYIDESNRSGERNRSGREPYLGKINTSNFNLGLGVEYRLEAETEFIHFFAEGKTNLDISSTANIVPFDQTSAKDFYAVNVGVRFGRVK